MTIHWCDNYESSALFHGDSFTLFLLKAIGKDATEPRPLTLSLPCQRKLMYPATTNSKIVSKVG